MSALRTDRDTVDEIVTDEALTTARPLDYLPGLLLLVAVGLLGKYAEVAWLALAKHEHWTVRTSSMYCGRS